MGLSGLIDIHQLKWWPEMCQRTGLNQSQLPQIARAGTDLGPILPDIAADLDLPPNCRFVVGCLDQYAGAIGAGNISPGSVSETTGTGLAVVQCSDRFEAGAIPTLFQGPTFAPGLYYRMVFSQISGGLLEWYRNQLPGRLDFDTLAQLAAQVHPGFGRPPLDRRRPPHEQRNRIRQPQAFPHPRPRR